MPHQLLLTFVSYPLLLRLPTSSPCSIDILFNANYYFAEARPIGSRDDQVNQDDKEYLQTGELECLGYFFMFVTQSCL